MTDLGGGKGPSAGFSPVLSLLYFWVNILLGFTLVVRGQLKSKAVSGWGKEITLNNCYPLHCLRKEKHQPFPTSWGMNKKNIHSVSEKLAH